MTSWLTYPQFKERYPGSTLTETLFTPLALDAALYIESATKWRAETAAEAEQLDLLADCQARLIQLTAETGASWDGVTSVNNHGYTESYASGQDIQSYLDQQQSRIVTQVLSAPATRWMLNAGGVYHPPRRR